MTELGKLAVVAHGEHDKAVLHAHGLIRRDGRVCAALARRNLAAEQIGGRLVGEHGRLHVKQREVDVLALPRDMAVIDRSQNGGGGVHRGHQVNDGDADFLRGLLGLASDAHQSAHRLNQRIVARTVFVRAVLPKTGDGAVNDARVEQANRGVVQTILRQSADFVVFDHNVCGFNQLN